MQFTLRGARLVDATMDLGRSDITFSNTQIQAVGYIDDNASNVIDASDAIITPGFIEVHTHGGGGFNLHTTEVEEINAYAQWVPSTGVTSFLTTVVGVPDSLPETQLITAASAVEQGRLHAFVKQAEILGIYLEGPYLSEKRRGAHPPVWLRMPDKLETERVLALTKGYLRLITLAPELPGAPAMIQRMVEAGVTVSMGHSEATYEQAQEAIKQGVTHATHCFNAMRSLHHREPGPIAAIAQAEQVRGELIADGVHVHPAMMDMLVRILGSERTIAITDAQSCAGGPEGPFEFAGQKARVVNGAAFLEDGTLTGSVLTMNVALRNIIEYTHVSLSQAVSMLTLNPARAVNVAERKGRLQAGHDADLLIFDQDLNLQATICRGQVVFATGAWKERLT